MELYETFLEFQVHILCYTPHLHTKNIKVELIVLSFEVFNSVTRFVLKDLILR